MRYVVVIPVLNQLRYTQQCVARPARTTARRPRRSWSSTTAAATARRQWLAAQPISARCAIAVNLGCGGAWTQARCSPNADWVVLLNNDVLVGASAMTAHARRRRARTGSTSSARRSPKARSTTTSSARARHSSRRWPGRCAAAGSTASASRSAQQVFESIGFLDTRPAPRRPRGRRVPACAASAHGVPVGTVGDALLHHFGSITQKAIKLETGQKDLGDRDHFYAKRRHELAGASKRFKAERKRLAREWVASRARARMATRCTCCARGGTLARRPFISEAQVPPA